MAQIYQDKQIPLFLNKLISQKNCDGATMFSITEKQEKNYFKLFLDSLIVTD